MPVYVALLRGINLAGNKMVAMSDLRELLSSLGFEDPRSLMQSGNLVFRAGKRSTARLEALLEKEIETRLGVDVDLFLRSPEEWRSVIARNPFPEEAKRDPSHLLVMFLRDAPDRASVKNLANAIVGRETVSVKGREAYVVYPDGVGRSKLTSNLIEKKLGTRATGRNWNTVLKLAELTKE